MKMEKLNDDKIRITLNLDDLKENDIDFHSFMSNSIESQQLFLNMLDKAEKELGFITEDYRIMIEALAMSNGNFILTVTRFEPEKSKTLKGKKVSFKRKSSYIDTTKAVYAFNSFDEFCDFCNFLSNHILQYINEFTDSISLYEYNKKYYLVLTNLKVNNNILKSFCACIAEFATFVNNPSLFESKLREYGQLIVGDCAIDVFIKHFC